MEIKIGFFSIRCQFLFEGNDQTWLSLKYQKGNQFLPIDPQIFLNLQACGPFKIIKYNQGQNEDQDHRIARKEKNEQG